MDPQLLISRYHHQHQQPKEEVVVGVMSEAVRKSSNAIFIKNEGKEKEDGKIRRVKPFTRIIMTVQVHIRS